MAWGRRSYQPPTPQPVKAFSQSNENQIQYTIANMGKKQLSLYAQSFTPIELAELFIEPDDRNALFRAYALAGDSVSHNHNLYVDLPWMKQWGGIGLLRFSWMTHEWKDAFFVPLLQGAEDTHALRGPRDDAPAELRDRYLNMAERMATLSYEYGLVRWVFLKLNQNGFCNTPAQMRWVWPPIVHILNEAGMKQQALELAQPSARAGDKARIPTEVQPFIRETYDIITRGLLIDEKQPPAGHPNILVHEPKFCLATNHTFPGVV